MNLIKKLIVKKVLFIVNPISGVGKQNIIEKIVSETIDKTIIEYDFAYTRYAQHATKIASEQKDIYDIIVAIGGDGTVNEVGAALTDTSTTMAIIPTGSGNGLARHLKIPMNLKLAVKNINNLRVEKIDTGTINNVFFANVAGLGFDALISHKFAKGSKRGFVSYLKLILKEYFNHKPENYKLNIDGKEFIYDGFLLTLANSTQFGNDGYIAPYAKITDGLLDVCMLKAFPKRNVLEIGIRLLTRSIHKSNYMNIVKGKTVKIYNTNNIDAHVDGEPITLASDINVGIKPKSLNVLVGKDFNL